MAMSKSQVGLGVVVVAGAAVIIFLQYQTGQKLRADNESLRQQIAQLKSDSQDTTPTAPSQPSGEDFNELLRLRGEVSALRAQTNQIAKLQAQNQRLREAFTNLAELKQKQQSLGQIDAQQQAYAVQQIDTARQAVLGMMLYANDNQNQFPTNFDQAASYYENNPELADHLAKFVIEYHGSMANVANPASAIVVQSFEPFMSHGKWAKAYGFADGHAEVHSDPDANFNDWEQQHVPVLKNQ